MPEKAEEPQTPARFVISDERVVNCYGIRVMTDGIDTSQYERNNVVLYMHQRGRVIGKAINLRKEGPVLTGEIVFDEGDDFAAEIKRKVDGDWLRACSPELEPTEWSDAPALLLMGQTFPTATKSKLYEISICDIPGNDAALRLSIQGGSLRLSQDAAANAELLQQHFPTLKLKQPKMKLLLSRLGLGQDASEEAAVAALDKVKSDANGEVADFILKLAKQAGLVKPELEERFLRLAKVDRGLALDMLDFSKLKLAGEGTPARDADTLRLSQVVKATNDANASTVTDGQPKDALDKLVLSRADWTARDWEKKDPTNWLKLKREKPQVHEELYRSHYGSRL